MSQYTMAGRVGGCERKTSLEVLEFGVDSADCSVQSAGSLLGGGLPKLAMSGGQLRVRTMQREQQQQEVNELLLCTAMPPRRQEEDRQASR